MKRFLLAPLVALSLSGCGALAVANAVATATEAVAINKDKVLVPATQGLIVAHNAYQGASATAAGVISGCSIVPNTSPCVALKARLPQIEALNNRAVTLLGQADAGQNVAANAAEVMNIVSTLKSLASH
jgi:hypothetical protein